MTKPIFVIGNPRSGTTLFRLMLTNHKNIVIPPECGFAVWWYEKYGKIDFMRGKNLSGIKNFVKDLMTSKKIETWKLGETELHDFIISKEPSTYSEVVSCVYEFYGKTLARSFTRWGDKNNFYIRHVNILIRLFSEPFFVHIVRDGRDVACSYIQLKHSNINSKYAPSLPAAVGEIAAEWRQNLMKAITAFQSIHWKNVLEIRYEDLVLDPEKELKRVCSFLSEEYDKEMLNYAKNNRIFEQEPKEFLQWKSKILEEPAVTEIGKYQRSLEISKIKDFERVAGDLLKRYNYQR